MVCKWACERATRERNTPVFLGVRSGEGEDTKEDGTEGSEDEIHMIENHGDQGLGKQNLWGFYGRTATFCHPEWTGTQRTAQTDVGHGNIIEGQLSRVLGQIPGLDRGLQ